ncbi:hypothetical protein AB3Y40_01980 [Yoonia sp. R2331]|uniref:helix-turn-helix domain-containing protein n=1 Tax=Yoonia sp. R2331 TaxID=3237238 RepID=UPI0034E3B1ED
MPKVDPDILKAFGRTLKRERARRGIGQAELGGMVEPPVGNSIISKIEKGQKEALGVLTVGKFCKALNLDESWIDKFLDAEETAESGETKAEREADQLVARLQREDATGGASDDLLIQLANRYTEGDHKDRETAYTSVRSALEELVRNKEIAALAGNADAQFALLMQQVDDLNTDGDFDAAAKLLDDEGDRIDRLAELHLKKQISQDRLRNDPGKAAVRLIRDIYRQAPAGGVFRAVDDLAYQWRVDADPVGDLFALRVSLSLAKANYQDRGKGKRQFEAKALYTLGWCHFRIAERSTNDRHLTIAKNAFEAAIKRTNKAKEPINWSAHQDGLGGTLHEIGKRKADPALLTASVTAYRVALDLDQAENSANLKDAWNNLGNALSSLGEVERSADHLTEAEAALGTALSLEDKKTDPLGWASTQNNLALARRWLGEVTGDLTKLDAARAGYAACEDADLEDRAPFKFARLQWNIADLALARYRIEPDTALLTEARERIAKARAFFVEGSDYQTQQCDDLLAEVEAAGAPV